MPQPSQRDHHELPVRLIAGIRGRMRYGDMFQRHLVARRYCGVGQIRGLLQRFKNRHALANARGLDAEHLAPEIAAQVGDVVKMDRGFGLGRIRKLGKLFNQVRNADQLFGDSKGCVRKYPA